MGILSQADEALEILDHVYKHVSDTNSGEIRFEAQREVIRAMSTWRASVAGHIAGHVLLPHRSWNLEESDFDPRVAIFFRGRMN